MRQRAHRRLPNMSEGGFRIKVRGKGCVIYGNERVRGIEPPCAAWEAAVLPLNYTRKDIFDFRFSIADCNLNNCGQAENCSLRSSQRSRFVGVGASVRARRNVN